MKRLSVVTIVGTDVHPFDRLIRWVDEWAEHHPNVEVFQQTGKSEPPRHGEYAALIPIEELRERVGRATAVVAHAGPATIADVRRSGRVPIVIPRDSNLGEHVDGHQVRYAAHIGATGRARVVQHGGELHQQLDLAISDPDRFRCEVDDRSIDDAVSRFAALVGSLAPRRS